MNTIPRITISVNEKKRKYKSGQNILQFRYIMHTNPLVTVTASPHINAAASRRI